MIHLPLALWGVWTLTSKVAAPIYSLPAVDKHSPVQCPGCQLLVLVFLILAILNTIRWNLSVVLIFISLIAGDDERFLKCLLVIFIFLRTVFSSRVHFLKLHCLLSLYLVIFIFYILILCQMYSWQSFYPIMQAASLFYWLLSLLYRNFLAHEVLFVDYCLYFLSREPIQKVFTYS